MTFIPDIIIYALLSAEQMFGDKKLDPRSGTKGNIRVPIKWKILKERFFEQQWA